MNSVPVQVLVPYRNREKHLKIFIEEFVPILRKHIPDVKVTIIEQSNDQRLFNRGKLLNAGIMEQCILDECSDSSRIVLHDIDTFGNDSCVRLLYTNDARHEDILRIRVPHSTSLGGICKIKLESLKKMNGFPNSIYGWGIEDRALYYRAEMRNIQMSIDHTSKHSFTTLPHESNVREYSGALKAQSDLWRESHINTSSAAEKNRLIDSDGLNTVKYTVLQKKRLADDVHIMTVDISQDVMSSST